MKPPYVSPTLMNLVGLTSSAQSYSGPKVSIALLFLAVAAGSLKQSDCVGTVAAATFPPLV